MPSLWIFDVGFFVQTTLLRMSITMQLECKSQEIILFLLIESTENIKSIDTQYGIRSS